MKDKSGDHSSKEHENGRPATYQHKRAETIEEYQGGRQHDASQANDGNERGGPVDEAAPPGFFPEGAAAIWTDAGPAINLGKTMRTILKNNCLHKNNLLGKGYQTAVGRVNGGRA